MKQINTTFKRTNQFYPLKRSFTIGIKHFPITSFAIPSPTYYHKTTKQNLLQNVLETFNQKWVLSLFFYQSIVISIQLSILLGKVEQKVKYIHLGSKRFFFDCFIFFKNVTGTLLLPIKKLVQIPIQISSPGLHKLSC